LVILAERDSLNVKCLIPHPQGICRPSIVTRPEQLENARDSPLPLRVASSTTEIAAVKKQGCPDRVIWIGADVLATQRVQS
jgi:hypothetical protein